MNIKSIKFKALLIAVLTLPLLLQAGLVLRGKQKEKAVPQTNFDRFTDVRNMELEKISIQSFTVSVPKEWKESWIDESELLGEIKDHYIENSTASSYEYDGRIIYSQNGENICIIKRDELYINFAVFDGSCDLQGNFDKDILTENGFDLDNTEILPLVPSRLYRNYTSSLMPIKNGNFISEGGNGYIVEKSDADNGLTGVVSVSMSDEFAEAYPGLDLIIAESLSCGGEEIS